MTHSNTPYSEGGSNPEKDKPVSIDGKLRLEIKELSEKKKDNNLLATFWLPLVSAIVLVVLTAGLTAYFTAHSDRLQKRWEMKREAGRRALKIVDQFFANEVAMGLVTDTPKLGSYEPMDLKEVREVCNELVISCDNTNAITTFLEILSIGRSQSRARI